MNFKFDCGKERSEIIHFHGNRPVYVTPGFPVKTAWYLCFQITSFAEPKIPPPPPPATYMTQTSVERKSQFGNSHPQPVAVLPQTQQPAVQQQKPAVPPAKWQQQPQVTYKIRQNICSTRLEISFRMSANRQGTLIVTRKWMIVIMRVNWLICTETCKTVHWLVGYGFWCWH